MELNEATARAEKRKRLLVFAGLWLFALLVLVVFRSVVLPFAGAAIIAYIVAPLVDRITRIPIGKRTIPRWAAILVIYAAFFAVVYVVLTALIPQIYRELARIGREGIDYANSLTPERIQEMAEKAEQWFTDHGVPVELSARSLEGGETDAGDIVPNVGHTHAWSMSLDLERLIHDLAARFSATLKENLVDIFSVSRSIATAVVASIFMLFFMLMVAAFMSVDLRRIKEYCRTLVPNEHAEDARFLVRRIDRSLSGVVRGQMTICLVNGTLTFIGLVIFGVKFAFLLATVALLFALIPIFGTILSSVPIVLIGLSQSWKTGLGMLLWIIGIHALEAYVLNPKIMGSAARIHPLVVAFALIAGERSFGLVGALLAVPIAAIAVACFDFARMKVQRQPEADDIQPVQPRPAA